MARRVVSPRQVASLQLISELNVEQVSAAIHSRGPLAILAQAGSGKTKTLISLCGNMIAAGIPAERILAVTFSKKAADEMATRGKKVGIHAQFSTWHAFALRVLKDDHTRYAKWDVDESDRAKWCVKEAVSYKHLDWKGCDLGALRRFIGHCKAHNLMPEDKKTARLAEQFYSKPFERSNAVRAYSISQDLIETAGLLTFDDMLCFCARHLAVEENRVEWARRFDFVMQDEAQDSNPVQTEIAELLTKETKNYVVVGDPAQSIYGFRGSSPEAVTTFTKRYPTARVVMMNRNYRSGSAVVKAANDVIRPASIRLPLDMIAESGREGSVKCVVAQDFDDEASHFASYVEDTVRQGEDYASVTCLFRTNAQSRALEEALLSRRIPYVILGGTSFYERKEVKEVLGYLRVAVFNDPSGDGLKRCINAPFRFLGAKFVERIQGAQRPGMPLSDVVAIAAQQAGVQGRQRAAAAEWCDEIEKIQKEVEEKVNPGMILTNLVQSTGYMDWLQKEEGEESIESSHAANIRELIRVASRFPTVADFLDYIKKSIDAAARQRKDQSAGGDRVLLMSIHRSKGLEWPRVWVVGLNQDVLPHKMGDMEEERRLAYVAFTRAKEELTVSYVREFATSSGLKTGHPSQFLIDSHLILVWRVSSPAPPSTSQPGLTSGVGEGAPPSSHERLASPHGGQGC